MPWVRDGWEVVSTLGPALHPGTANTSYMPDPLPPQLTYTPFYVPPPLYVPPVSTAGWTSSRAFPTGRSFHPAYPTRIGPPPPLSPPLLSPETRQALRKPFIGVSLLAWTYALVYNVAFFHNRDYPGFLDSDNAQLGLLLILVVAAVSIMFTMKGFVTRGAVIALSAFSIYLAIS